MCVYWLRILTRYCELHKVPLASLLHNTSFISVTNNPCWFIVNYAHCLIPAPRANLPQVITAWAIICECPQIAEGTVRLPILLTGLSTCAYLLGSLVSLLWVIVNGSNHKHEWGLNPFWINDRMQAWIRNVGGKYLVLRWVMVFGSARQRDRSPQISLMTGLLYDVSYSKQLLCNCLNFSNKFWQKYILPVSEKQTDPVGGGEWMV